MRLNIGSADCIEVVLCTATKHSAYRISGNDMQAMQQHTYCKVRHVQTNTRQQHLDMSWALYADLLVSSDSDYYLSAVSEVATPAGEAPTGRCCTS